MTRALVAVLLVVAACSTRATGRTIPGRTDRPADAAPGDRAPGTPVRVALVSAGRMVGATTEFAWYQDDGQTVVASGRRGDQWALHRQPAGDVVRAVRGDGTTTPWSRQLIARVTGNGFVTVNGARYRGSLSIVPEGDSLVIVNRVPLEEYLRAVVAREMGNRPATDSAALQAQAVAARSYAVTRLGNRARPFDVHSTVLDQVYGGVDAENERATAAVHATRGLVLRYEGRVVDAPYSSTCGGTTAEAPEVWRNRGAPYLRRVSDRIAGTERFYCDIAPRFRWTRTFDAAALDEALATYLARYAAVPRGGPGRTRRVEVLDRTSSGRVGALTLETERGRYTLRGNEIRFVLRRPGGEILNSTYFSVETEPGAGGFARQVTLRGQGYGHGIGMCQWGAIGRSRAGQSFRTILATYYPGTSIGPVQ